MINLGLVPLYMRTAPWLRLRRGGSRRVIQLAYPPELPCFVADVDNRSGSGTLDGVPIGAAGGSRLTTRPRPHRRPKGVE
jgi:hypothetical protein